MEAVIPIEHFAIKIIITLSYNTAIRPISGADM